LFETLPTDIHSLASVVRGLLFHYAEGGMYHFEVSRERVISDEARCVEEMLARILALNDQPLTVARPLSERLVGCCRDYSLLLTAMLRHQGIPARPRFGFSRYFNPAFGHDHVVTEYWDQQQGRWLLVDAQQDELHVQANKLTFDPHDIPHTQFPFAGRVWQQARTGKIDPNSYGYDPANGGWWVIQQYLVHDLAALNKREMLIGDLWGLGEVGRGERASPEENLLLDEVAALTLKNDDAFTALRACYEDNGCLRVPSLITSYNLADQRRDGVVIEQGK
jgi:hypothetical protein